MENPLEILSCEVFSVLLLYFHKHITQLKKYGSMHVLNIYLVQKIPLGSAFFFFFLI